MLFLDQVGDGTLFTNRNQKMRLDRAAWSWWVFFTSIADGRDSTVEVFEADHTKATGIQKLGQILYLRRDTNQIRVSSATQTHPSLISSGQLLRSDVMVWRLPCWPKQSRVLKNNLKGGASVMRQLTPQLYSWTSRGAGEKVLLQTEQGELYVDFNVCKGQRLCFGHMTKRKEVGKLVQL